VGYEDMDARQLQQACRDRGLPTARDKATMVARLTAADEQAPTAADTAPEEPDPAPSPPAAARVPVAGVWQERYPADAPLTDREHQANCSAVQAAAQAAGYATRGSGRRARTVGGEHVYEVYVR
jgi:hypothetical protein